MFSKLKQLLFPRRYYIIADTTDDSVTLSRSLYRHIRSRLDASATEAKAFVFFVPHNNTYGFVINYPHSKPTIEAPILYNAKFKSIGFQATCPSVNRIFYDYHIQDHLKAKLLIHIKHLPNGTIYYEIQPPRRNHTSLPR